MSEFEPSQLDKVSFRPRDKQLEKAKAVGLFTQYHPKGVERIIRALETTPEISKYDDETLWIRE